MAQNSDKLLIRQYFRTIPDLALLVNLGKLELRLRPILFLILHITRGLVGRGVDCPAVRV
jgi:hypothetical protein